MFALFNIQKSSQSYISADLSKTDLLNLSFDNALRFFFSDGKVI